MSGVSKGNGQTFRPCKETFKAIKAEKNCTRGLYLFMSSIHINKLFKN